MHIIIDEDQKPLDMLHAQLLPLMTYAAGLALEREGVDPEHIGVSLSFVPGQEIRELNTRYLGKDSATDVLSFPMYGSIEEIKSETREILLGDIVISLEAAAKQADEIGQSIERELMYLFVHSMFHLLGYDHENIESRHRMRTAEEDVLREIEWEE